MHAAKGAAGVGAGEVRLHDLEVDPRLLEGVRAPGAREEAAVILPRREVDQAGVLQSDGFEQHYGLPPKSIRNGAIIMALM
jgi:hypothetical protein